MEVGENEKKSAVHTVNRPDTNGSAESSAGTVELGNAKKPKVKTISKDLPVEEHVPCIENEAALLQIEVLQCMLYLDVCMIPDLSKIIWIIAICSVNGCEVLSYFFV